MNIIHNKVPYLVPALGFEPRLLGPKPKVLPLDDTGISDFI